MSNVLIRPVEREIYSKLYQLDSPGFHGNTVYVHADCYENPERKCQDEYYMLDLYISVGQYPNKNYLVGVCFGNGPMAKQAIDHEIDSYVDSQVDELFFDLITDYLDKEAMWEQELNHRGI